MKKFHSFSVLIPTRERCETLYWTILSVLANTYPNFEIIISDNFSRDSTQEVVESFKDDKIKYFKTPTRLSMAENFEFALTKASCDYVISIGDDDGLLPNAFYYLNNLISISQSKALACSTVSYTWGSFLERSNRNRLTWSYRRGYEIRKSKEWLDDFFTFRAGYINELPGIYCGVVERNLLNKIKGDGTFFRSITPDAYSSFAIAHSISEYVYSFTPFVIHGASGKSNGASQFSDKDKTEIRNFYKENTLPVHKEIEFCSAFRVQAMEAYFQFRDNYPDLVQDREVDWKVFLSASLTEAKPHNEKELTEAIKVMAERHQINPALLKPSIKESYLRKIEVFFIRLRNIYNAYIIRDVTKYAVYNVKDAALLLHIIIESENGSIENSLSKFIGKFKNIIN